MPIASTRLDLLQPYLFARLDAKKAEARATGVDVIDFGIGDPDLPSPTEAVEALCEAARRGEYHHYPPYRGTLSFREACADWLLRKHGVAVDPETEVLALIGSKEALAHLCLAVVNPGNIVLCPDPSYPAYHAAAVLSGAEPFRFRLFEHLRYLPDLSTIPQRVAERASLMFLNYPNNPTGACANGSVFNKVVGFARSNDLVVCHDAAYIDTILEDPPQACMLATCKDKSNVIELFSFSKAFNMAGWRIAFAAGDAEVIAALAKVKTNIDSSAFIPIQMAAIEAMRSCEQFTMKVNAGYRERRDILLPALKKFGIEARPPRATFYVWGKVPGDMGSAAFAEQLLLKCGILAAPGVAFGKHGEGYIRLSLTLPTERVREAVHRLSNTRF